MVARPIWRGHLRLALVSCPVAMYNTRHERNSIRLNMINPKTGNRIKMVTQDAGTGQELSRGDTVKGYEFEKGRYVVLSEEDLASVKVESSSMMAVEKFVDAASIDPIYYDASYYLAPDGKGAEDVYAVLREAVVRTGKVALTRVVISQRERTVAVRPVEGGLVAHTLNEERDLNGVEGLFDQARKVAIDPEMVKLAIQLVDRQTATYDPADLEDRYETRMRAMIDAKVAGMPAEERREQAPFDDNVVDLIAALKRSLSGLPRLVEPIAKPETVRKAPNRKASAQDVRTQPALKLPIAGGKKRPAPAIVAEPEQPKAKPRKRA